MNQPPVTRLALTVAADAIDGFCLLTGNFRIRVQAGCSVREMLCEQLGVDCEYVENRIQTVFLDSSAVDDLDKAVVSPGAVIALSAAMPGVAGAMLRKGSHYSPMRSAVSHRSISAEPIAGEAEATVTLKLFNMIQKELGPGFLKRGITIDGKTLADLLIRREKVLKAGVLAAEVDGRRVEPDAPFDVDWSTRTVELTIDV